MVLARTVGGLQRRIEKEGASAGLKCKVTYGEEARKIEEVFEKLQNPGES
jgi:pyridoxal phosphate phosphatase PHOSPHO2